MTAYLTLSLLAKLNPSFQKDTAKPLGLKVWFVLVHEDNALLF